MRLELKGRVPSKKNSRILVCRGKFPTSIPSKAYSEWHTDCMWQLKPYTKAKNLPLQQVESIFIEIYAPDKRAFDLSNKAESLMDLMVDAGIIKDDNVYVVPKLELVFGGIDKENPRAIVVIHN